MVASSSSSPRTTTRSTGPKRSLQDRTTEEALALVRELLQITLQVGPQAAPARTLQATRAFALTLQDVVAQQQGGWNAPKILRTLFERLGATYIKLGQFIASSPTLFPPEYVTEFQALLDQTTPLEWRVVKQVIESELGPISRTFEYVDPKPLASASIAQVHAAKLRSTGEDVVLKVQKPGIGNILQADLGFVLAASKLLEFVQPDWERTSLSGVATDLRSSMLEELDFLKEAQNLKEFRSFLQREGLDGEATAPKVYDEYTTKKVLTMERLYGVSLLDADSIASVVDTDPEQAIISALNVWTTSVMKMPWFHADVHGGNLLLLKKDGRVGFLDFGIVGRVSPQTFEAVNSLSNALALGDYRGMAEALTNMGAADKEVDLDQFAQDLESLLQNLNKVQPQVTLTGMDLQDGTVQGRVDIDESEITQVLLDFVQVTENNGLKLPREFGLLVKQSLYFDRYLKNLAPTLDLAADDRIVDIGGTNNNNPSASSEEDPRQLKSSGKDDVVIDV